MYTFVFHIYLFYLELIFQMVCYRNSLSFFSIWITRALTFQLWSDLIITDVDGKTEAMRSLNSRFTSTP